MKKRYCLIVGLVAITIMGCNKNTPDKATESALPLQPTAAVASATVQPVAESPPTPASSPAPSPPPPPPSALEQAIRKALAGQEVYPFVLNDHRFHIKPITVIRSRDGRKGVTGQLSHDVKGGDPQVHYKITIKPGQPTDKNSNQ